MILANDVSHPEAGFEVDTNLVRIFYRNGTAEQCPLMSKAELADVVLDRLLRLRYPSAAGNGAGQ
jgi:phosphopantothenoylcysteine decarboxylase/phosphopantothenate--cysteine ligase